MPSLFLPNLQEYPTLTTFFEGEIISERYPFLTRKWDASEEVDKKHWSKFPGFAKFSKTFNSDSFSYAEVKESDCVFMRWKVGIAGGEGSGNSGLKILCNLNI